VTSPPNQPAPDGTAAPTPDAWPGAHAPDGWPDAHGRPLRPDGGPAPVASAPPVGLDAPAPPLMAADDTAAPPPSMPPQSRRRRFRRWRFAPVVEILVTIALALALAEGVQAAVVKPFVIPSPSMEPTLAIGQRVLVNRLAFDFGSPQRGEIVVFHPPLGETCAASPIPVGEPCPRSATKPASVYYVKRVIGLPGQTLSIRNGHPVINGHPLSHEPYITPCGNAPECNMPDTITIPPGEYYMMGDNRGDSDDSRIWGPVPGSWIIGEVFATYWPPDRIGFF
jgi:signal peptidase I